MYDKIPGTDLDEQYVAFALIDCENFLNNLYGANIISQKEHHTIQHSMDKIARRCGLKKC